MATRVKLSNPTAFNNAVRDLESRKLYGDLMNFLKDHQDPDPETMSKELRKSGKHRIIIWVNEWSLDRNDWEVLMEMAEESNTAKRTRSRSLSWPIPDWLVSAALVIAALLVVLWWLGGLDGVRVKAGEAQKRIEAYAAEIAESVPTAVPPVAKPLVIPAPGQPQPQLPVTAPDHRPFIMPDGAFSCSTAQCIVELLLANEFEIIDQAKTQRSEIIASYGQTFESLAQSDSPQDPTGRWAVDMLRGAMKKDSRLKAKNQPLASPPAYKEPQPAQANDPACAEVRAELTLRGIRQNLETLVAEICPKYLTIRKPGDTQTSRALLQAYLNGDPRLPQREFAAPSPPEPTRSQPGVTLPTSVAPPAALSPFAPPPMEAPPPKAKVTACFAGFAGEEMKLQIFAQGVPSQTAISRYTRNKELEVSLGLKWEDPFLGIFGGGYSEEGLPKCQKSLAPTPPPTVRPTPRPAVSTNLPAPPPTPPAVVFSPVVQPTKPSWPSPTIRPTVMPPLPSPTRRIVTPTAMAEPKLSRTDLVALYNEEVKRYEQQPEFAWVKYAFGDVDTRIARHGGDTKAAYLELAYEINGFLRDYIYAPATAAARPRTATPTLSPELASYCLKFYRPWLTQALIIHLPSGELLGYEALNIKEMEPLPKGTWTYEEVQAHFGLVDQWRPSPNMKKCEGYQEQLYE